MQYTIPSFNSYNYNTALSIWHAHSKKGRIKEDIPEKDYITLNILAAQSGLTTAQEQSQFRACNDIRRRDKDKDIKKSHPAKDMVYGIQTRFVVFIDVQNQPFL